MKKYLYCFFLVLIILGCNNNSGSQRNSEESEIVCLLYSPLAKKAPIPPPFMSDVNEQDSLKIMKKFNALKDSLESVEKVVVAVHPIMKAVDLEPSTFQSDKRKLVEQLNSLTSDKALELKKIQRSSKDSIVAFEKRHLREYSPDYIGIDRLISFSRIAFDAEGTEAAVIATTGTSRLDSHTAIYFLKKQKGRWVLVDWKTLSIS